MIRTKERQELHDSFVAVVADILVKRGFNIVFADLPGKTKPPKLNGHIPDVYAIKVEKSLFGSSVIATFVVEVETEESLNGLTTVLQHLAFRTWAINNKAVFEVVVAR